MSNPQIRSSSIYVTNQVSRWLAWISISTDTEGVKTPSDAIADDLLRQKVLELHPNIESLEADYWRKRKALDKETVEQLKLQTENETNAKENQTGQA